MKEIIFRKETETNNDYDGYMFIYNFNVDFTSEPRESIEFLKVFAKKHDLNTSLVLSHALQFYYKAERDKIYLTPVRISDLVTLTMQKNSYLNLIKQNSNKTALTSRLKLF